MVLNLKQKHNPSTFAQDCVLSAIEEHRIVLLSIIKEVEICV